MVVFSGIMGGDVFIDSIGDRIADYSLLDMTDLHNGDYQVLHALIWATFSLLLLFLSQLDILL